MKRQWTIILLALTILPGCRSLGPGTIERDRMHYMTAVSESLKTQMLLNLVKVRYGDMPVFMDISSVINQYSMEGDLAFNNSLTNNPYQYTSSVGITGRYTDRPTITYSPMTGNKFTRSLMTPIPPGVVLNFLQSGKNPDYLLHLCVQAVNGIRNQGMTTPADPRFERLVQLISQMQQLGGIVVKFGQGKEEGITSLVITNPNDLQAKAARDELRELLHLKPNATEYTVVYGGSQASDTEIAMVTRSVFDIMAEVALAADVPQSDIDQGRAYPYSPRLHEPGYKMIARIHSGTSPSPDAAVAVRYRDLWFWIDDRDLESKKVLSTLLLMVNLAESGQPASAPLVTIPAG